MGTVLSLLALAIATALGFFYFPGHHFLQQDTQIWMPVLAHANNPALFRHDLIVTGAHIRLTIFDDVTIALVRWCGVSFETALYAQQLLFRFLALFGVWLLARATGLSPMASVLAATICNMGAVIMGPAVLGVEFEPVPRGFSFGLTLFALGLMAHKRYLLSGLSLGLAFAYHAPVIWPVLLVAAYVFWRAKKTERSAQWQAVGGFAALVVVLAVSALLSESGPMNPLFARISPEHANLQIIRATYNWVSLWGDARLLLTQYVVLAVLAALAFWRLGKALPAQVKPYLAALPAIGLLSVPLSYLLLEQARLALIPQIQIMRSLLFTLIVAVILMVLAGLRAASEGRWWEAPFWLAPAFFIPMAPVWTGKTFAVYLVAAGLAIATAVVVMLEKRRRPLALAAAALVMGGYFFAPSGLASVRNYPTLGNQALDGLIQWAQKNTAQDDVFLFRDIGKRTEPGVFRARAHRAVYVDWKGGGQVNYYEVYAKEWWRRWETVMKPEFEAAEVPALRAADIRYLVFRGRARGLELEPVYQNSEYRVYRLR